MNAGPTGAEASRGSETMRATPRLLRDLVAGVLIIAAAVALGLFQNSVSADPLPLTHQETRDVAVITDPQQVQREAGAGAVLIDSRSADQYAAGHIKGALNLPLADREKLAAQFVRSVPSSNRIIVYCDTGCDASARLAAWLGTRGWTDVAEFTDGMSAWSSAGLPVSSGAQP